jgi:hypothetical protein
MPLPAPNWRRVGAMEPGLFPQWREKLGQHPCRFADSHGAAGRV